MSWLGVVNTLLLINWVSCADQEATNPLGTKTTTAIVIPKQKQKKET